mmetsp:Transcript_5532/g.16333  ORF Transcript_5532/g.16333 Transcript_5532/m.16333 type:complete len:231 (-) Transcript_5532:485-1177(-)
MTRQTTRGCRLFADADEVDGSSRSDADLVSSIREGGDRAARDTLLSSRSEGFFDGPAEEEEKDATVTALSRGTTRFCLSLPRERGDRVRTLSAEAGRGFSWSEASSGGWPSWPSPADRDRRGLVLACSPGTSRGESGSGERERSEVRRRKCLSFMASLDMRSRRRQACGCSPPEASDEPCRARSRTTTGPSSSRASRSARTMRRRQYHVARSAAGVPAGVPAAAGVLGSE